MFDGTNPDGWILRAERYFSFYRLSEEEKIEATVVALEGKALLWVQYEHRRRPIERWEQAKTFLRRQFRSSSAGSLQEQWLAHVQEGTLAEYRMKFIELIAPLEDIPEEIALGQFLTGLKEDVRTEVRLFGPISVDQAMDLAIMVEDKLRLGTTKRTETKFGSSISKGMGQEVIPPLLTRAHTVHSLLQPNRSRAIVNRWHLQTHPRERLTDRWER